MNSTEIKVTEVDSKLAIAIADYEWSKAWLRPECRQKAELAIAAAMQPEREELARLRLDKERLDWLNAKIGFCPYIISGTRMVIDLRFHRSIRKAIDSAHSQPAGKEGGE